MAEYTKLKRVWQREEGYRLENDHYYIGLLDGERDPDYSELICSAVNMCVEFNPENPLAVVEEMGELVEICKEYDTAIGKFIMALANGEKMHNLILPLITPVQDKGRKALASIERGK